MVISIGGYPVYMRLGCFAEERLAGQEVKVSLKLEGPEGMTGREASLLDLPTLDYGQVLGCIDSLLAGKEVALIETAVAMVGHGLLAKFPALLGVEVVITKPILPGHINKGAEISVCEFYKQDSPAGAGRS